mgnify:CR=1 FL=1
MSAYEITEAIIPEIENENTDFICLNFANPDMVGHTGDMEAAIKAVEAVDKALQQVIETANEVGYRSLIIADHGNADQMIKPDGSPHTAHTTALVPAIFVGLDSCSPEPGKLADVAPTLLKMMGMETPEEMTGKSLY